MASERTMLQVDAKRELLRLWLALPKDERRTECQAADFARAHRQSIVFRCRGDRYPIMKGWLMSKLNAS